MATVLNYKSVRLISGVAGKLFFTDGGGGSSWTADTLGTIKNFTPTPDQEIQRFVLDDSQSGSFINGRISLDSSGALAGKPLELVYNGGVFPTQLSFPLHIYLQDAACASSKGIDVNSVSLALFFWFFY
jgi:hypothetical protein